MISIYSWLCQLDACAAASGSLKFFLFSCLLFKRRAMELYLVIYPCVCWKGNRGLSISVTKGCCNLVKSMFVIFTKIFLFLQSPKIIRTKLKLFFFDFFHQSSKICPIFARGTLQGLLIHNS
jgi:hypothetical protein